MGIITNTHIIDGQSPFIANVDIDRIKFAMLPIVTDAGTQRLGDMNFLHDAIVKALAFVGKSSSTIRMVRDDFIVIEINYGSLNPVKATEFFKKLCEILRESKYVERLYLHGEDMRSRGFQIYRDNVTVTYIRYGAKASAGEEQ